MRKSTLTKSAVATAVFGLLLFGAAPAFAEDATADVTFDGGCGLIGITASSKPDKSTLTVDKDAEVSFKNDLGANATLYVGSTTVDVDKGKTIEVKIGKSAEVKMLPKCWYGRALLEDMGAMTVSVKDSPEAPAPAKPSPSSTPPKKPTTGSTPGVPAEGAQPSVDGKRPVADGAVPPDGGEAAPTGTVPSQAPAGTDQHPVSDNNDHGDAFAVEPVNGDATPSGSTGLLALIATVALVGVGAAAVRTVASQRQAAR
ncbi:hypothetical protein Afil01_23790 [Actinorhabdospora filicis]|uniref:Uncharacterized protein n=1 Tax=Actinorhabdospora filicis TaxID=1785913 RepID=A0A9W6W2Z7_9ACTN|nr:hypothetical protein [Actinorhabdospora filicis]GLZ77572.1 hypothetical protein Afil01_23790 [Actinorhabdospora filicis]